MTLSRIFILVCIVLLIVVGMVRYGWLVQQERTVSESVVSESVSSTAVPEGVMRTEAYRLPLLGSAPQENVYHTIDLSEVRRGCFRQDCIPSVDRPEFVPASSLQDVLESDSLGIYMESENRFYPFPMLETREIVNDVTYDGDPYVVTYCPLCGTGIVFGRTLQDGTVAEFGVSGMLWQSNLLMYNRADDLRDRNLWSQVLGQAVIGDRAGEELRVWSSDVRTYADILSFAPDAQTLTTGTPRDPYGGDYYGTAQVFQPDYDPATSPIPPMTRVHGIIVNGQAKAYVSDDLFDGMTDIIDGERIFVAVTNEKTQFIMSNAERAIPPTAVPDIEGFWFSWAAAHPDTQLWTDSQE